MGNGIEMESFLQPHVIILKWLASRHESMDDLRLSWQKFVDLVHKPACAKGLYVGRSVDASIPLSPAHL